MDQKESKYSDIDESISSQNISEEGLRDQDKDLNEMFKQIASGDLDLDDKQLSMLSGIDSTRSGYIETAMGKLDGPARFTLIETIGSAARRNVLFDFTNFYLECLKDDDHGVRAVAASGLGEGEDARGISALIKLVLSDTEENVRAEAAISLGPFALQAVLGVLPITQFNEIVNVLKGIVEDTTEEAAVRAGALASIGVFDEPWVQELIYDGFESVDSEVRLGAIQAMGRTADDYWLPTLINILVSIEEDERIAAAIAIGEIGSEDGLFSLGELLGDNELEVVQAAAVSLGEIGGPAAVEQLEKFLEHPDEEIRDVARHAIDFATSSDNPLDFNH